MLRRFVAVRPTGLAIIGLVLAASCAPEHAGSPPPVSATPSPAAASAPCEPIDLRRPDGLPLDLTGTWADPRSSAMLIITQTGSCVVVEVFSVSTLGFGVSAAPGATFRAVYDGVIDQNFAIVGPFVWTWVAPDPIPTDPRTGTFSPYFDADIAFDSGAQPMFRPHHWVYWLGSEYSRTSTSTEVSSSP